MKNETWLLVANSSTAKVFKVEPKHILSEITTLDHPESRLHARDIMSDKPGRSFNSVGAGRHAMETKADPKSQEYIQFARTISHYLEKAHSDGLFTRLYISASPAFLGILRQNLNPHLVNTIKGEGDKDITHFNTKEILEHLPFVHL